MPAKSVPTSSRQHTHLCLPCCLRRSPSPIQDEPAFYTSCPGSQLLTSQPLLLLWHVPTTLIPSSSSTSSLPASGRAYTFPSTWYHLILQPSGVRILLCLRGTDFIRDLYLSLLFVVNPVKDSSCGLTLLPYRCFQMTLPLSISKEILLATFGILYRGSSHRKPSRKARNPPNAYILPIQNQVPSSPNPSWQEEGPPERVLHFKGLQPAMVHGNLNIKVAMRRGTREVSQNLCTPL